MMSKLQEVNVNLKHGETEFICDVTKRCTDKTVKKYIKKRFFQFVSNSASKKMQLSHLFLIPHH